MLNKQQPGWPVRAHPRGEVLEEETGSARGKTASTIHRRGRQSWILQDLRAFLLSLPPRNIQLRADQAPGREKESLHTEWQEIRI